MVLTPFHYVPRVQFLKRMAKPCLALFLTGFFIVEAVVRSPMLRPSILPPMTGASAVYGNFFRELKQIPEGCWMGEGLSDFQARQCEIFWDRVVMEGFVASIPMLLSLLFLMAGLDLLVTLYRKTRNKIKKGEIKGVGKADKPVKLPMDVFGWIFCLQPISVSVEGGKKIRAYVPLESTLPMSGKSVAVYSLGRWMGEERMMAILYAPHMAIFSGQRVS